MHLVALLILQLLIFGNYLSSFYCTAFVPNIKNSAVPDIPTIRSETCCYQTPKTQSTTTTTSTSTTTPPQEETTIDPEYPYQFQGRLWFKPTIVKIPKSKKPNPSINFLSIFGYSLGGTVALEYDVSPVGPYREYVTMSALVTKRLGLGQWGSRLYVSNQEAEDVCRDIWGVPAECANIEFNEGIKSGEDNDIDNDDSTEKSLLQVGQYPDPNASTTTCQNISVNGWHNTRILSTAEYEEQPKRRGNIPVLWTPTIKALWAPLIPIPSLFSSGDTDQQLPLHNLRLSASAIRLRWSGLNSDGDPSEGIPLGLGLVVDNVLIEISPQVDDL